MKINFYGVGAALNKTMDNTYFLIEDGDNKLQVDCGGGLGLAQIVNRDDSSFENIFITHKHSDHLLGFFNLIRTIRNKKIEKLNVYCSSDVEKTIRGVIDIMNIGSGKQALKDGKLIFKIIDDEVQVNIGKFELEPINLNSKKIEQFGFLLTYDYKKILFFGDEAVGVLSRNDLDRFIGIDYLVCEALNPDFMNIKNGGKVQNKKISHITARESGKIANKLKVKNLVLVHTLEDIPGDRQSVLKNEAELEFDGNIIVPNQGDVLEI